MIRRLSSVFVAVLALSAAAADNRITSNEVAQAIAQAISRAEQIAPAATIAVVDREGFVVGVWALGAVSTIDIVDAITKAGTASFLSSDQHAFTSRTAGFIVQQNFPPAIRNRPPGPLVGVNFSNMSFTDINRFKNPNRGRDPSSTASGTNGAPIQLPGSLFSAITGLAGSPGGVPLFRDGNTLIGGVGVSGKTISPRRSPLPPLADIQVQQRYDVDEDVALAGQIGFQPKEFLLGTHVFIDGIRVPYIKSKTRLGEVRPLGALGRSVPDYPVTSSPMVAYPIGEFGGQLCEIRAPIIADPMPGGIRGQARLTLDDVTRILSQASARAKITRAGIRLPRGQAAQTFIAVVNNPDRTNTTPVVLGTIRTPSATIFSWDVAVQKARTSVFFSDDTRAFSPRTVGFLAQRFYPPGIARTPPGPFYGLQEKFSLLPDIVVNILNGVDLEPSEALGVPNPSVPNGITIFPGGFPLYRNGVLIGAIGISGDGIDQDDIIGAAGSVGFAPPANIRADNMQYRGARLPYAKFPRNPDL